MKTKPTTKTIGGLRVRFPWTPSDDYLKACRDHAKALTDKPAGFVQEGYDSLHWQVCCFMAARYARWLAPRQGIDTSVWPDYSCDWTYVSDERRVRSVTFVEFKPRNFYETHNQARKIIEVGPTIEIPHWDWQPSVQLADAHEVAA